MAGIDVLRRAVDAGDAVIQDQIDAVMEALPEVITQFDGLKAEVLSLRELRTELEAKTVGLNEAMHRCTTAYAELKLDKEKVDAELAVARTALVAMTEERDLLQKKLDSLPADELVEDPNETKIDTPPQPVRKDHSGRPRGWVH